MRIPFVCGRYYDELTEVVLGDCRQPEAGPPPSSSSVGGNMPCFSVTTAVPTVRFADEDASQEDKERLGTFIAPESIALAPTAAERDSENGPPVRPRLPLSRDIVRRQYDARRAMGAVAGAAPLIDPPLASLEGLCDGSKIAVRGAASFHAAVGTLASAVDLSAWHVAQVYENNCCLRAAHRALQQDLEQTKNAHALLQQDHEALRQEHEETKQAHEQTKSVLEQTKKALAQILALPSIREKLEEAAQAERQTATNALIDLLHTQLYRGDAAYDRFRQSIEVSRDVNAAYKDGQTPLYAASLNGHTNVVAALIAAKADVFAAYKDGQTPLYVASHNGHADNVATRHAMHLQFCF